MSSPYPEPKPHPGGYAMEPPPTNTMGVLGFVFSIVGVVTCGFLSPLGVLFSFIGLFKEPKGLAIGGLVISLLGSLFLFSIGISLIIGFYSMMLAFTGLAAAASQAFGIIANYAPLVEAQQQIVIAWEDESRLPTEEEGNQIIAGKMDNFGNQVVYRVKNETYALISPGPDGKIDTGDDLTWGYFDQLKEYDIDDIDALPPDARERIEKEMEKMDRDMDWLPDPDQNEDASQSDSTKKSDVEKKLDVEKKSDSSDNQDEGEGSFSSIQFSPDSGTIFQYS